MDSPLVSILIPMYNSENYIDKTIISLSRQTYKNIEIIIVDDHSNDHSYNIAKKYETSNIKVFINPGKGGNSARNYAFSKCKGEYIKFLDADDFFSDNIVEEQINYLLKYGTKDSVAFSTLIIKQKNGDIISKKRKIDKTYIPAIELLLDMWNNKESNCPHCHLMSRTLFEKSKGWNEEIIKNQDGEFFSRIYSIADKAIFVPDCSATWNRHFGSVSSSLNNRTEMSVVQTYLSICNLILSYKNDNKTQEICSHFLSDELLRLYPKCSIASKFLYKIISDNGLKIEFSNDNALCYLRPILGWRVLVILIKLFNKISNKK